MHLQTHLDGVRVYVCFSLHQLAFHAQVLPAISGDIRETDMVTLGRQRIGGELFTYARVEATEPASNLIRILVQTVIYNGIQLIQTGRVRCTREILHVDKRSNKCLSRTLRSSDSLVWNPSLHRQGQAWSACAA